MYPQSSPNKPPQATFFSRLPTREQSRLAEILSGWGLPPEMHEEYVEILVGHLKTALDGYLAGIQTA